MSRSLVERRPWDGVALHAIDTSSGAPTLRLNRVTLRDVVASAAAAVSLSAWAARERCGVVYVMASTDTGVFRDVVYAELARCFGHKVIVHLHGARKAAIFRAGALRRHFVRRLTRLASAVIVPTDADQEGLVGDYGYRGEVHVVRNWPDVPPGVREYGLNRHRQASRARDPLFLAIGRVSRLKGTFEALGAMAHVLQVCPNALLVWVGSAESSDEWHTAKKRMEELGIQNRVVLTGPVTEKAKWEMLLAADAFVLPSYSEGFPLALLEAMAAGLPLLTTRLGTIIEVLGDEENALLCEPGDVDALAENMTRVALDPCFASRLGHASARDFWSSLSLDVVARRLQSILAGIAASERDQSSWA